MANTTRDFFLELASQHTYPSVRGVTGTGRFVISGVGVWHVTIDDGNVQVSQQDIPADVTITSDEPVFDRIVRGEADLVVAVIQRQIQVTGNLALATILNRLLPTESYRKSRAAPPMPEHPADATQPVPRSMVPASEQKVIPPQTVSVLEGSTFVVSDRGGNIDASPTDTQGLFAWDTRFLSRWQLTVNGIVPRPLSIDDLQYYAVQFFLVPATGTVYVDSKLSVIRTREVGNGFREKITILNHANQPVDLDVQIAIGSDFADIFEVKDALTKNGVYDQHVEDTCLVLGYERERFRRETRVKADASANIDPQGISYRAHIDPHAEWSTTLDVVTASIRVGETANVVSASKEVMRQNLDEWIAAAPRVSCAWDQLEQIYHRSLVDLAALRFFPQMFSNVALPAAGLPWFMTIFGRDSIITSLQALPYNADLAETTLRALAAWQGFKHDDFRDEEPGKIIHEVRFGETVAFEERPQSPYYGAADATPLYLILLDEYERWTGNAQLVRELEWTARAALDWIDKYGDSDGDGFVDYNRRNTETGLENQCWKDSWDSILFADGTLARLPRATCEIQGYVYDAKRRAARLARQFWNDPTLADRLEQEAAAFKEHFNREYWLADRGYYALAIADGGRKVDALTSNIGHLLWSGIADDDKAAACVRHLMGDRLFSGWGVRTMAEGDGGYNPIGYHVGTVWPHDNAIIALGLTRYGYRHEAAQITMGILQAATYFHNRLPEAFAGYPRARTDYPVEYPTACSPQAWATGTPLMLLQAVLGLEPIANRLLVNPHLPAEMGWLGVFDIPGRWGRMDAFARAKEIGHEHLSSPITRELHAAARG